MASDENRHKPQDDLLLRYKPLGLKAVVAAHEVKGKAEPAALPVEPFSGPLPEGFHMPMELD
ncbi:hypothetical protein [Pararhizobium sp.]|uniref:hypothetical protein n=1 Tax=Pararhizobium sp. TaxID=1977563 RepID=UPI00271AC800|nr:hypothetical protein [Pararhizobium sp.]MDO9417925.1 hypothetical protein [Pararhizobium sp.]